jgi:hypothetical protein
MTAQRNDFLYVSIYKYPINSEPLSAYIENLPIKPKFVAPSTACWRGYIATWKIIDNKLHLIELDATTENYAKRDITFLFPGQKKVFAEWFSGTIEALGGGLIEYHHQGYHSKYKYSYVHTFENGILVKNEIVENETKEFNKESTITPVAKLSLWRKTMAFIKSLFT